MSRRKGNCGTHRANEGRNGKRRNGSPNNTAARRRRYNVSNAKWMGVAVTQHSGITSNDKHLVATIHTTQYAMCVDIKRGKPAKRKADCTTRLRRVLEEGCPVKTWLLFV